MTTRPRIFISAVSRELKNARQLVANTLLALGYEPVWQDIFGAEQGDLREMLRRQVDTCSGLIQIVGHCHGFEPPVPDATYGRVSYTQYEALYARTKGMKVWYLLLDRDFHTDSIEPEPDEKRVLQEAYRQQVKGSGQLYHPLQNTDALEAKVFKLRDELADLRRRGKQWAALVIMLLLLLVTGGVWLLRRQGGTDTKIVQLSEQNEKLLTALRELPQTLTKSVQSGPKEDEASRMAQAYADLEEKLKLPVGSLAKELPKFAELLLQRSDTSMMDRASALFATKKFSEAEATALEAKDKALASAGKPVQDAIEALELAGNAAEAQIHYAQALDHYRAAAALTDEKRDPLEWARVQWKIACVLSDEGKYHDAEVVWQLVLPIERRMRGPEHPETLKIRDNLANEQFAQGKYAQTEAEDRAILAIRQRVLGPEHPDTLRSRMSLAIRLDFQGKHAEAEAEDRAILAIQQRVLGQENPITLHTRYDLANALNSQHKHAEAEAEHRAVLAIRQRVLGPKHPDTLRTQNNLANTLHSLGKDVEAEAEHRAVLAIQQRVVGPEQRDTLRSRMGLANALSSQGKHAEAVAEDRAVLAIQQRVLGQENPDTLHTWSDLANALNSQGKYAEAGAEHRAVLAIRQRVLGQVHRDVFDSCYNLALCLEAQKNLNEALEFAERAESGRIKVFGADHFDSKNAQKLRERIQASLAKEKAAQ